MDSIDFIQTDGENYYSMLSPSEALTKLEDFMASTFDDRWNKLLMLESYNEELNAHFHLHSFGYKTENGRTYLPDGSRERTGHYGYRGTFALNFQTTLFNFDNKFASNVRESVEDEIKSFNEYRERAETLYPKYEKLVLSITKRLQELTSESYFLAVVESVNKSISAEKEKERLQIEEENMLREEAAEKARVEKAEKHEIWLVDFSTRKREVRNTGICGCTDRKNNSKDNYPTKADAYKVAAKQMEKTDDLDLNVYKCKMGQEDSYGRHHEYGGWHLTRKN